MPELTGLSVTFRASEYIPLAEVKGVDYSMSKPPSIVIKVEAPLWLLAVSSDMELSFYKSSEAQADSFVLELDPSANVVIVRALEMPKETIIRSVLGMLRVNGEMLATRDIMVGMERKKISSIAVPGMKL